MTRQKIQPTLVSAPKMTETRQRVSTIQSAAPDEQSGREWFKIENATSGDTAHVSIMDEIGMWGTSAKWFIRSLNDITSPNITLHLNSPGGDVWDGVAIYNALVAHDAKVTVSVEGLAASAASFIAQAGDEVKMGTGSTMMIHDASGLVWGNAAEMAKTATVLDKVSNSIASIYAARTGEKDTFWRDLMKEEVWYTAQEAVDAGLADSVDKGAVKTEPVKNSWLSIFNHAGRSDAPSPIKIMDRIKETHMGDTSTTDPEVKPEETEEEPAVVETPAPAPAPAPETPAPANRVGSAPSFMVNGKAVTDSAAVQRHITALETAADERAKQARVDFVNGLVTSNKVGAPQAESLIEFASELSDKQWDSWTKTWDVAVSSPLFGNHGGGASNLEGHASSEAAAQQDRLSDLKDIIAQHKRGGMKPEAIEKTPSFKELKQLDTTFTL